ncbi:3748_t:CDS:2 [Entrophospora sp. SA101]|nr:3748_t:CDS:2 [Entrophospora sp. SA101]CAJ0828893.1 333_t:CDS:2 [Entrophospora sp. SA101]CAJ0829861.1 10868_t:CDS:2 [Entrophospora sp. SA101]
MVSINNQTSLEINERYQERLLVRARNSRFSRRNTIKLPEGVDPLDMSFESIFDDSNNEQGDDNDSKKQKQIPAASNNNSPKLPNSSRIPKSSRTNKTKKINELEARVMIENIEPPPSSITKKTANPISEIRENSVDSNNQNLYKSTEQTEVERPNGSINPSLDKSTDQVEEENSNDSSNQYLNNSTNQIEEEEKPINLDKPDINQLEEEYLNYSSNQYLSKSAAVQVIEERPSESNNQNLEKSAAVQVEEKSSGSSVKISLTDSDFYNPFENRRMTRQNKGFTRKQSGRFTLNIDITDEIDEQSIAAPNKNLGFTMIEKQDSSPTIALDEISNNNTSTLEIISDDQISTSMKSPNSQSPKPSDIEEDSYLPLINNDNGFDGTFVLEPSFASSLAKPTSILSILEKPASFGNIPITIPVQYETDKKYDPIGRNIINKVLPEEEMEEDEEENFTAKHLSDPNERKRTIYLANNDQEEKKRKHYTLNVNEVEDGNIVRKTKKRSYSKHGNPTVEIKMIHNIVNETIDEFLDELEKDSYKNIIENFKEEFEIQFTKQAEIIRNQLSLHEFFNQKLIQMKKVKDDLLEVKQKREIISKNMSKERELFKKEEEDRKKLEGLHNFLSNIEFLRESVALEEDVPDKEYNHHHLDLNEISGLIISITSRTGDLISNHNSEEGALSIIKRYNKLLETCQEILEKEC